jgi:hypothetical protein
MKQDHLLFITTTKWGCLQFFLDLRCRGTVLERDGNRNSKLTLKTLWKSPSDTPCLPVLVLFSALYHLHISSLGLSPDWSFASLEMDLVQVQQF